MDEEANFLTCQSNSFTNLETKIVSDLINFSILNKMDKIFQAFCIFPLHFWLVNPSVRSYNYVRIITYV